MAKVTPDTVETPSPTIYDDLLTNSGIGALATYDAIRERREELAKLPGMGPTDYSKYLSQAQQTGKLQLALALAQQGFEAAGTVPREGEWALTTLGRGLAPIAPLVGKAASDLQKQRTALKLAEKQEQRALTTAALTQEQTSLDALTQANLKIKLAKLKAASTKPTRSLHHGMVAYSKDPDGNIDKHTNATILTTIHPNGTVDMNLVGGDSHGRPVTSYSKPVKDPATLYMTNAPVTVDGVNYGAKKKVSILESEFNKLDAKIRRKLDKAPVAAQADSERKPYQNITDNQQTYKIDGEEIRVPSKGSFMVSKDQLEQLKEAQRRTLRPEPKAEVSEERIFAQVGTKGEISSPQPILVKTLKREYPQPDDKTYYRLKDNVYTKVEKENIYPIAVTHSPYKLTETVTVRKPEALKNVSGLENARVNEKITVWTAQAKPESGLESRTQMRFLGKPVNIPESLLKSGAITTAPLTQAEKRDANLIDPLIQKFQSYHNYGTTFTIPKTETTQAITVDFDKPVQLSGEQLDQLSRSCPKCLNNLIPQEHVKGRQTYYVTGEEEVVIGTDKNGDNKKVLPGDVKNLSDAQYKKLIDDNPALADVLVATDDKTFPIETRKKYFNARFKRLQQEHNYTNIRSLTSKEEDDLFAAFGGNRMLAGRTKQLRETMMKLLKITSRVPATDTDETKQEKDYKVRITSQLQSAEPLWNEIKELGGLSANWEDLNFVQQYSFARIPRSKLPSTPSNRRGLGNYSNTDKLWNESIKTTELARSKRKSLSPRDKEKFYSAARLLTNLEDLVAIDATKATGVFVGLFGKYIGTPLADWPFVGSDSGTRLEFLVRQAAANASQLEAVTTGPSGRDLSDFKFEKKILEQLPEFVQSEEFNKQLLQSLISDVKTGLRSYFESQDTHTIPRELEVVAKDLGLKDFSPIEPKKQWWIDPNREVKPAFDRRIYEQDVLKRRPWTKEAWINLSPGAILPIRFEGRMFIKMDDDHIADYDPKTRKAKKAETDINIPKSRTRQAIKIKKGAPLIWPYSTIIRSP